MDELKKDDLKYDLWLMKLDIGCVVKNRLTDCLGSAKNVYEASEAALISTNMVNPETAARIEEDKKNIDIDRLYEDFTGTNQKLLTRSMPDFPDKLKAIPSAPFGIFYIGHFPESFDKSVAIVGARRCSEYGRSMATELAEELSKRGYIIISGMALGIDNASHVGALRNDGVSVAVLGCGVDICYPRGNIRTYNSIQDKGAIISEYYPNTQPVAYNFPPRNRIISALANQVIIIEARDKSGSLITADFALSQGRDVYALPGRINDTLSYGCNKLIGQGASIITSISGFISDIEEVKIHTLLTPSGDGENKLFLEKEDSLVYSCLDFYPKSIEDIVNESTLELMRALSSLMNLCDMGYAKEAFVNQYVRLI